MDIKHSQKPSKPVFMDEQTIIENLLNLEKDGRFDTSPILARHSSGTSYYISFLDKHTTYLKTHPKVDPANYLANLKTMLRVRR